jgi:ssDNA thymidine ADP-ribosyltransferase, DarT
MRSPQSHKTAFARLPRKSLCRKRQSDRSHTRRAATKPAYPFIKSKTQKKHSRAFFKIKTNAIFLQNTCFSDMNATDAGHTHGSNLSDLERVNFAATKMTYLTKEDPNFKFSQAEVMVKTWIPLEYITNIHNF